MVFALGFLVVRWHRYNFAYNYLGEEAYNAQVWLHPDNRWVAAIEYIRSGQGYILSTTIVEDSVFVEFVNNGEKESIVLDTRDAFFFSNNSPSPEKTSFSLFARTLASNKFFSYTCTGTDVENLYCYYFINVETI